MLSSKELERLIPGLAELRAEERRAELLPWIATERRLCGVWVRQLTLRALLELGFARNAFCGSCAEPTKKDIECFLWRLSVLFTRHPKRFSRARREWKRIVRIASGGDLNPVVRAIREFIAEQEQDRPPSANADAQEASGVPEEQGFHFAAGYVNFFGNEYGWSDDKTLDTPIARLNQLYRAHRAYHGSKLGTFRRSERLIGESVKAAVAALNQPKG